MVKSGFLSSEFWAVLVAGIITAFGKALGLPDQVISWLVSLALSYLGSRTAIKLVLAAKFQPDVVQVSLGKKGVS